MKELKKFGEKETQQELSEYSDNHNGMFALPKQPQVDFEMLKETVDTFLSDSPLLSNYKQNMKLFFHLLSTKPTFAKVAYKELNKLSNH